MEINLQQFILQIVNFSIIFLVLAKFVYKPILKILDERAKKVTDGLRAAEKSITEQVSMEETKQKELIKAQKEAANILDEASKKADQLSKSIVDEAREEAKKAISSQEKQLRARLEKEEIRLKGEISNLVASSTRSVLRDSLSEKHQKEIIKSQISDLKKLKVK